MSKPELGEINSASAYPLELFEKLAGLNKSALRSARRKGLRMAMVGRRKFVLGKDFLEYLEAIKQ